MGFRGSRCGWEGLKGSKCWEAGGEAQKEQGVQRGGKWTKRKENTLLDTKHSQDNRKKEEQNGIRDLRTSQVKGK